MFKPRAFQARTEMLMDEIRQGRRVTQVIASVTPGGGKSAIPVIAAAKLLGSGWADRLCWVVPRISLQGQAKDAFNDPAWRAHLRFYGRLREAGNDIDPARDAEAYSTTIQAVACDDKMIHAREFARRRYILVIDEGHHIAVDSEWHKAIAPLVERAKLVIHMSGTLSRHDGKRLAFLGYRSDGDDGMDSIDLRETEAHAVIRYRRRDALREKAIIPCVFEHMDARAEWIDANLELRSIKSFAEAGKKQNEAIYAAVTTGFAEELMDRAVADWRQATVGNPRAKLLVVCANIAQAKEHLERLKQRHFRVQIATSHETAAAMKAIEKFKRHGRDAIDILVTVAMAYEGLDVPSVTHLACLTHVRSYPWIDQMLARATRYDRLAGAWEDQVARAYVPDDLLMREIIQDIRTEQIDSVAPEDEVGEDDGEEREPREAAEKGRIEAIGSAAIAGRASEMVTGTKVLGGDLWNSLAAEQEEAVAVQTVDEEKLRSSIHRFCAACDFRNNWKMGTTNKNVYAQFRKRRDLMTYAELKRVEAWLKANY